MARNKKSNDDTVKVDLVDLPARQGGRRGGKFLDVLLPLVGLTNPEKKWSPLPLTFDNPRKAGVAASQLRSGKTPVPPGQWEFAARGNTVFARRLED